jgi:hypothetical protein
MIYGHRHAGVTPASGMTEDDDAGNEVDGRRMRAPQSPRAAEAWAGWFELNEFVQQGLMGF